jgi:hypothetical protein
MRLAPRCPRTWKRPMRRHFGATWTTTSSTRVGRRSTKTSVVRRCLFGPLREIQSRVRRRRYTRLELAPLPRAWPAPLLELWRPPAVLCAPAPLLDTPPLLDPLPLFDRPPPGTGRDGFEGVEGVDGSLVFGTEGAGGTCGGWDAGGAGGAGGTGGTGGNVTVGRVTVVGSVTGGGGSGGRSAAADATQPAISPGTNRASWTGRRRSRDLIASTMREGRRRFGREPFVLLLPKTDAA